MEYTDEVLEERILWFAARNYLPNRKALVFNDLKPEDQEKFYSIIRTVEIGFPVMLFLAKKGKWTLFGTRKIVSGSFQGKCHIGRFLVRDNNIGELAANYDFIAYSAISTFDLKIAQQTYDEVVRYSRRKFLFLLRREWRVLITEKGGRQVEIFGPRVYALYRMTNMLTMILWMINGKKERSYYF